MKVPGAPRVVHRVGRSVRRKRLPTAAVDNSALSATRPQSTYQSGNAVQTIGTTSLIIDTIYARAKSLVVDQNQASVALVQRHLRLGYGAACALFERMQAEGLVAPIPGATRQWVLVRKSSKS